MTDTTRAPIRLPIRRLAAAAGLALALVAIPVATATTASADELHCVDYLRRENVLIGPKVVDACNKGASDSFAVRQLCFPSLADRACGFASDY